MSDILHSHTVSFLKQELSKTDLKGYSKMKKSDLVEFMMKHPDKFSHIKKVEKQNNYAYKSDGKEITRKFLQHIRGFSKN